MPKCDGDLTIVRVSRIKPGGSLEGYMKAAAAHLAWYRANKITTNQIVTARVIETDKTTGCDPQKLHPLNGALARARLHSAPAV